MDVLDRLLTGLRQVCAGFPDKRKGGAAACSMADIGLPAFSRFFMRCESFLACRRGLEEGRKSSNCRTLSGMAKIPAGDHIRAMPDPGLIRLIRRICSPVLTRPLTCCAGAAG